MPSGPNDEATQFLLDVMHNPKEYMRHRIDAAVKLLEIHGPKAFATRWVGDPRDPSPNSRQPIVKIIIQGIPDTSSVSVEPVDTGSGVNDKDLEPFRIPLLH
jgi:hypothetical protein